MPTFPTDQEIAEAMEGLEDDYMVPAYGDGSQTTPTNWWAALGGFGAWIPNWNPPGHDEPHRYEIDLLGPTIGQTGSSTRHDLMAWTVVLAKPVRTMYATDSAAMLCKAKQLLAKAARMKEAQSRGKPVRAGCPFKKHGGSKRKETYGRSRGKPFRNSVSILRTSEQSKGMPRRKTCEKGSARSKTSEVMIAVMKMLIRVSSSLPGKDWLP